MRRRSSPESLAPTPLAIHPQLQAALGSLDVQLEEELARYRRQKGNRQTQGGRSQRLSSTAKTARNAKPQLDLIAIGATGGRTQPHPEHLLPDAAPHRAAPVNFSGEAHPKPASSSNASSQLAIAPHPSETPDSGTLVTEHQDTATENPDLAAYHNNVAPQIPLMHPGLDDVGPEDYLESSEELLRSLAEEEEELRAERGPGFLESLLTPLGVGSMLLILLSSATLGYVIMNPSFLGLDEFFRDRGSSAEVETPEGELAATDSGSGDIPNSPNLASREFVDINLKTLSILPPNPETAPLAANPSPSSQQSPAPAQNTPSLPALPSVNIPGVMSSGRSSGQASPSSQAQPQPPAPAQPRSQTSQPRPQPSQASAPQPRVQAAAVQPSTPAAPRPPAPSPSAAPPAPRPQPPTQTATAPAASSASSAEGNYVVVTEYSGDRSLEEVQQVVEDAYLNNSLPTGGQIQAGSFSSESGAQERAEELQREGIPARVYQP